MRYLLDTNQWSYLQERHPHVTAHVRSLPAEAVLYMSVVTQAELLAGVQLMTNMQRRQELRRLYHETVALATEVLPITSEVAEHFARVYVALKRIGRPIETNDIWIASIAFAHDLILVTSDEHFQYIPGLVLEDWSQQRDSHSTASTGV